MKTLILSLLITIGLKAQALEIKQNKDHLNMAISTSQSIIEIQLEASMDILLGFSHKPQTTLEQSRWKKLQKLWFKNINQLISIQNNNCMAEETSIEYELEKDIKYGEVLAKVVFKCAQVVKGKDLVLSFKQNFNRVKGIDLTLFIENKAPRVLFLNKKIEKITI